MAANDTLTPPPGYTLETAAPTVTPPSGYTLEPPSPSPQAQALARPDLSPPPPAAGPAPMQQVNPYTGAPAGNYQAQASEQTPQGSTAAIAQREASLPVVSAVGHTAIGVGKGAGETGHTLGRIINAVTGDNIGGLPTSFTEPDYLKSDNGYETAGKVAESVGEFVLGDEALKGITVTAKLKLASKLTSMVGTEPYIAKIVEAGINATRMGIVGGVQAGAHDESIPAGAASGLVGGAVGEGLGAGAEYLKTLTPEATEAAAQTSAQQGMEEAGAVRETSKAQSSEDMSNIAGRAQMDATGVKPKMTYGLGEVNDSPDVAPIISSPDYTFNQAADGIRDHFNPVFDTLREESGGQFDVVNNEIKAAKKVIFNPPSVEAYRSAQESLVENQGKLDQMFEESSLAPDDLQAAKDGWRKASTLDDMGKVLESAFTPSQGVRQLTGETPYIDKTKMVSRLNRLFDPNGPVGTDAMTQAIGKQGVQDLADVHSQFSRMISDSNYAKQIQDKAQAYLAANPSTQGKSSINYYIMEGLASGAAHFLGASNPVVGAGMTLATVGRLLYTHPADGAKILGTLAKGAAPAITTAGRAVAASDQSTGSDTQP